MSQSYVYETPIRCFAYSKMMSFLTSLMSPAARVAWKTKHPEMWKEQMVIEFRMRRKRALQRVLHSGHQALQKLKLAAAARDAAENKELTDWLISHGGQVRRRRSGFR